MSEIYTVMVQLRLRDAEAFAFFTALDVLLE